MTDQDDQIPIFVEPFEDADSLMPVFDTENVPRQTWYEHKGVVICVRDFTNLHGDEAPGLLDMHGQWMERTNTTDIRLLLDVTGGIANKQAIDAFKKSAKKNAERYKKVAVVGVKGALEFYLQVINKFSNIGGRPFRTRGEAMDWLAEP
jgi:hypothetical protein